MELKPLNNITLRRKGYIEIRDIVLPIHTRGIQDIRKVMRELKYLYKIPMKVDQASEMELNALKAFGYNTNKVKTVINRIDEGSDAYKEYINKEDKVSLFLAIAVQVDLLHPIGDDPTLWQHLKLQSEDDVLGLAEWLSSLGMDESDRVATLEKIKIIKESHIKTYEQWTEMIDKKGEENEK